MFGWLKRMMLRRRIRRMRPLPGLRPDIVEAMKKAFDAADFTRNPMRVDTAIQDTYPRFDGVSKSWASLKEMTDGEGDDAGTV